VSFSCLARARFFFGDLNGVSRSWVASFFRFVILFFRRGKFFGIYFFRSENWSEFVFSALKKLRNFEIPLSESCGILKFRSLNFGCGGRCGAGGGGWVLVCR
jgi:hypothetical protein